MGVVSSILTVHAPARALHLRKPSVPIMSSPAGSPLYDTSQGRLSPGCVTNFIWLKPSRQPVPNRVSIFRWVGSTPWWRHPTRASLLRVPCLIPAAAAICPSSLHVLGGAAEPVPILQQDSATAGRTRPSMRHRGRRPGVAAPPSKSGVTSLPALGIAPATIQHASLLVRPICLGRYRLSGTS